MTKAAFSTLLLLALAGATYGEDPSMEALRAQYRRQVLAKVGTHYAELNSQALLDAAGDVAKCKHRLKSAALFGTVVRLKSAALMTLAR